ncbi:aminotransferase class I/II-fold pyridoxal phosphate-dependent enzyme [Streptomyces sp. NBC_01102]|uniref:aminotransferase class I/II-fold pyridoxal phosphate-dependent enzyme n=1 Tax=unclassified Streptomyces TaxID=2593676 RepID=UPI003866C8C1|nr:aminotransferase class I/II-fold pyridoxal phosphate-dependent enzyme [Streptomyces sp. NBC_01102]
MTGGAPERSVLTLADYERLARGRLAPDVWDWIAGGAGEERTLAANIEAFDRVRLLPRMLTGAPEPDSATKVLGATWSAPVGVAPMAYHTIADPEGELATVRAAGDVGVPVVVSTFAGRTFEELASVARAPLWLQTYCFRDRAVTRELVARAEGAGFEALVLTVDAPRLGRRLRDLRNGFRLPPGIVPANLPEADYSSPGSHARTEFDPAVDWAIVDWLRSISRLPVVVKGLLAPGDAIRALEAGADGIVVSNHGGRQLDGVPAAIEALPAIADVVGGRCALLVDGGVRRATDVLAALASGADAVFVGRPVLYGLAVDGEAGVRRVLETVCEEFRDAMALAGAGSVADLDPELIGPPRPVAPRRQSPTRGIGALTPLDDGRVRKEDLHASLADAVLDTMTFLNEITARYPDAVSFAPGRPFEGFFSVQDVHEHLDRYLEHLSRQGNSPEDIRTFLYQYGATAGQIRDIVTGSLRVDEGIDVAPEAVVVTVGCQEAMLITLRALFRGRDDVLLVSTPAYVGITGAARLLDITVTGVEEDPVGGLSCAAVEAAVRAERARGRRPKALYVVPDHSNPSGNTIGVDTRRELLDLASRFDFLILEDSPYRGVSPGERVPTLKALDRDRRVVHLGSYSKTVFPGARVGFAVADQIVVDANGSTTLLADELAKVKSMVTVNTSSLSQAVVAGMLLASDGELSKSNEPAARHYGHSLNTLLASLDEHFPADRRDAHRVRWNAPTGGFFLAVQVPFPADEQALVRSAESFGVIWTPMSYFHPNGGGESTLRLSFSSLTPERIRSGAGRLAEFIEAETARTGG